ncbi:helix-turn-helix transcriptional regulator [Burkholderia sp. Ap-962]|nr:helix-turn-helix transcriptional regulator [Burkholderia sp. Ap-962]
MRPLLQGFRKAAGLTQADVAERLGVTQQTYARLETNPASASLERLFRVMRVLGIEMNLSDMQMPQDTPSRGAAITSSGSKRSSGDNW